MLGVLMAGRAWGQSDPMALFKSDAAPYIRLSKLADAAAVCGLRSGAWNNDAQSAIEDKFTYFAGNVWDDPNSPDASKAQDWANNAATLAQGDGEDFTPKQCAALSSGDDLPIIDDLIITDTNLPGAAQDVPMDIPANPDSRSGQ